MKHLYNTAHPLAETGKPIFIPFAGAGTAGVAAMRTGRKAVLIELEEKWCEMAAKRMEKEQA